MDELSKDEEVLLQEIFRIREECVNQNRNELILITKQTKSIRDNYPVLTDQSLQENVVENEEPPRNVGTCHIIIIQSL